ncbi:MAG: STAS domain-containing protein [Phycisphaerae bacterium]|nr:STAS domain-containing protein [Phycisphaerae bacterium]
MEITETTKGAVLVLRPRGPLCGTDASQLRERATAAAAESMGRLVLDASAVPFVDSVGLEALADVGDVLGQTGHTLRLAGANETVREVLDLTDLASQFEHFEDVNAAVRSFL